MSVPSSPTLRTVLTKVRDALEQVSTGQGANPDTHLKMSPSMFSASSLPKTLVDNSFVLDLQSKDNGIYRNGYEGILRMEHTLKISVVKVLKPLDQFTSYLAGLDLEEKVIKTMNNPNKFDFERVLWVSTTRTVTPTREHLILDFLFSVEHDYDFS